MVVLGLTGRLGSGKSAVANLLAENHGATTICSDALVHELQQPNTPQTQEVAAFFGAEALTKAGAVDRVYLSARLSENPKLFDVLERIFHPAVRLKQELAIAQAKSAGVPLLVLDTPLLYQAKTDLLCTAVLACICAEDVRKKRALQRVGMSPEKLALVDARHLSNEALQQKADFCLQTDIPLEETAKKLAAIVERLTQRPK